MSDPAKLRQLAEVQARLRAVVEALDEPAIRAQHHPDLSPLGWHLGHCSYIELFWLHRRASGEPPAAELEALYAPESSPKPQRGGRLSGRQPLLDWTRAVQQQTLSLLAEPPPSLAAQALMRDDYLLDFLLQHHAQHLEIMRMVLSQRAATQPFAGAPLTPCPPRPELARLPAAEYAIGSEAVGSYDNEQPIRRVRLRAMHIARRPVSNAEYLAFMDAGAYFESRWWCPRGWAWRRARGLPSSGRPDSPEHWRHDETGWFEIGPEGPRPLLADEAVLGLSGYEAAAFARWAGGRLPHEYEWEAAARLGLLAQSGRSWEWCGNRFHPYPGYKAFPYDGYSLPWFDGAHYVLRGGSRHTHACIRRPSFRNFYAPDKRHIFAGLRLAFDP